MKYPTPYRVLSLRRARRSRPLFVLVAGLILLQAGVRAQAPAMPESSEEPVVLNPFEVNAADDRGYVAGNAISATRINTGINDLPFSIAAFTPQFIADTGSKSLMDIATQSAGVKSAVNATTLGNATFTVRGFSQPPQRNGFSASQFANNFVDASVIERVEIVKGPASLLYGAISPGGTVNYITKSAELKPFSDLDLFIGSYNYDGATLDVNQPLVPDKLLFRLVGSYQNLEDYIQYSGGHSIIVYPDLKWNITPKLALKLDYQSYQLRETAPGIYLPNTDIANPQTMVNSLYNPGYKAPTNLLANKTGPDVALGFQDVSDVGFMGPYPALPNNFNDASKNDVRLENQQTSDAEIDMMFSEHWNGRTHFEFDRSYSEVNSTGHTSLFIAPPDSLAFTNGQWGVSPQWAAMTSAQQIAQGLAFAQQAITNPKLLETTTQNGTPAPALLDRAPRVQEDWVQAETFQTEAVGNYNFSTMKLQLLGGIFWDHARYASRVTQNNATAASPNFRTWDVNPASPTYYVNADTPSLPGSSLSSLDTYTVSTNSDHAVYGLVNATFFNRIYVVGGARYNVTQSIVFDNLADPAPAYQQGLKAHYTTPQIGVGYKITPDVMVYASYSESYTLSTQPFTAVAGVVNGIPTAIPTGSTAPTIGKGYETGVKAGLLNNTLTASVSVYQVEEDNVLTFGNENISGFSVETWSQGAKQRGRGVELNLQWAPITNWQIVFSGSEEDIRNVAEPIGFSYYLGQTVGFAAKTQANLWTRYDFTIPALKGFWIGGGVDYTGKSAGDPRNVAYFLPAYTLYNSVVGYSWQWNKLKMDVTLNFKNMGNTFYKQTPNFPGEPRRFLFDWVTHF